ENNGYAVGNFQNSRYYAFPIPQDGLQVLWNHITRYRGGNMRRIITQATPSTNGTFIPVRFEETVAAPQDLPDLPEGKGDNIISYFKQQVTAPARLAGNVLLVYETLDQLKEPRMAWVYNAGQRRVRRAPQVDYDGPGTASDGMRTCDNFSMYNGAPDGYHGKLVGQKEVFLPYNAGQLCEPGVKYADVLKAGHVNPEHTRFELDRVWEVQGNVKQGQRHIYDQRNFFVDEDSWMIGLADHYDGRGTLWRVGEGHLAFNYTQQTPGYTLETLYDLLAGRYIALGMYTEEASAPQYGVTPPTYNQFTPAALRAAGVRRRRRRTGAEKRPDQCCSMGWGCPQGHPLFSVRLSETLGRRTVQQHGALAGEHQQDQRQHFHGADIVQHADPAGQLGMGQPQELGMVQTVPGLFIGSGGGRVHLLQSRLVEAEVPDGQQQCQHAGNEQGYPHSRIGAAAAIMEEPDHGDRQYQRGQTLHAPVASHRLPVDQGAHHSASA